MLRITFLSLLLGALALTAGLTLFFAPGGVPGASVPGITLSATNGTVMVGTGTFNSGALQLQLNTAGAGVVSLSSQPIDAYAYTFLHLALAEPSNALQVVLSWQSDAKENNTFAYVPHSKSLSWMWLATREISGWAGNIVTLNLVLIGQPGETVRISNFGIFPSSPSRQLGAIVSDLTGYVPWSRAAMNSNTGVTPVSSFYPTALVVALLALSLLAYGVLLLAGRARLQYSWRVVALIFLACWISLDLLWQTRLLHQLADTYRTFAGKNAQEKLTVGPDATLYNFIAQVIPLVQPKDTRIFVSTSDTYLGQRGAYYLYPFNVYWPGPGGPFPPDYMVHGGDLVMLIKPTTMSFDATTKTLATSPNTALGAELVFDDPLGQVVRVK